MLYKEDEALIIILLCQLSDYCLTWERSHCFPINGLCCACYLRMLMLSAVQVSPSHSGDFHALFIHIHCSASLDHKQRLCVATFGKLVGEATFS